MDENEVVEQGVELDDADFDAFDSAWDDDADFDTDDSAITDDEGSEDHEDAQPDGDQSEDAETEADTETEEQGNENEEGNQLFTINYLGNEERLTLEQMTELAQKGRDYDHVREERDKLKGESGKYAGADRQLAFLKDLADRAGLSVDEQIDRTRALWLMNEEFDKGNEISETEALLRVQREKGKQKDVPKAEERTEEDYSPQIDRFLSVYPDVQATDIPQEVWNEAHRLGGDLLAAYQAYEIQKLKEENTKKQQEERNNKNKERSTGPRSSAGASKQRDDFDEGWDSE